MTLSVFILLPLSLAFNFSYTVEMKKLTKFKISRQLNAIGIENDVISVLQLMSSVQLTRKSQLDQQYEISVFTMYGFSTDQ